VGAISSAESLIGTVVAGRFRLDQHLGGGQMADVYVAEQLSMQRNVALKILRRELTLDSAAAARFRREVTAVNRLQSPHTIRFYDFGETDDGTLYIAMELLTGGTFRDRLEAESRPPIAEVLTVLRQVALSLDEAHGAGVIHRDLKPENIHLDDDPRAEVKPYVKVLDFGLARITDGVERITGPNTAVGSPAYIAPEMIVAGRTPDHRADLYALGVIAFEAIVGRRPYDLDDPLKVVLAHASHPIPRARALVPELPEGFDDVVQMSLAKEPAERFQSGAALVRAITESLGEPLTAAT
jgi:eukaryotic-like serine/threonine-protein kinase